jgi:hypothetical protein
MSKNTLNESTVRRFMKLANINSSTFNFPPDEKQNIIKEGKTTTSRGNAIARLKEEIYQKVTAVLSEQPVPMGDEEMPEEELEGMPPMGDEEMPMGDEEMPMEGEGEVDVKSLVDAIAAAITQETGIEVRATEEGEEGMPEEELEGMPPEEGMPEEELGGMPPEEELAEQLYKRVAMRLMSEQREQKIEGQAYNRVVARLLNEQKQRGKK